MRKCIKNTSRSLSSKDERSIMSAIRPGVPTIIFTPFSFTFFRSTATSVPPTRSMSRIFGITLTNGFATWYIWDASSRVGDTMIAPTYTNKQYKGIESYYKEYTQRLDQL